MTANRTKSRKKVVIVLTYIFVFLAGCFLCYGISTIVNDSGSLFYQRGSYSLPKTVVVEESSPNGELKAFILREDSSNAYYFAIQRNSGSRMIVDADFMPKAGYHHPIFTLSWNKGSDEVSLTIDHDFGESNLEYVFDIGTLSWVN
jgi:hypothetical protein